MEKQRFREFLLTRGHKHTKGRVEILDEILNIEGHFDPDELFIRMKTKGSGVSRASIYRTIPLLVESGYIERVENVDRHAHYERVSSERHHDHMICMRCGKVIEFYSRDLEDLQEKICRKEGFRGVRHSLEILGCCSACGDCSNECG